MNKGGVSMDIFPDDLEQVYDIVVEHKLCQTWLEEATPKLIKDQLEKCKVISQSFCVSSGVTFSGNNDLWKVLLFCESFRLRRMQW